MTFKMVSTVESINKVNPTGQRHASERFAEALRSKRLDSFSDESPYAASLFPLLKALGWKNIDRELMEALPHFAKDIDLVDMRNMLVSLGYESTPLKTKANLIKSELYPCLFVADDETVLILQENSDGEISYFDAQQERETILKSAELDIKGVAYLFTHAAPEASVNQVQKSEDEWFTFMVSRFKKTLLHLFTMTFVINIAALLVPLFIMLIYDKVIGAKSLDSLPLLLSGAAILISADLVLRYFRARVMGAIAGRMDYLIGVGTFKQLLFLPPIHTERSTVAAQLSRLKQFDSIRDFFTGPNASIVLELPFVILFLVAIALLAGSIALVPLGMVLAYIIFGLLWLPSLNRKIMRSGKARTSRQGMLIQTFDGRREIKAIGGETVWQERFRELSGESIHSNYNTFVSNAFMSSLSQSMMTLTGVIVLALGAMGVMEGTLTIGALIATMALVWRVLSPIQGAFLSVSKFQQTMVAVKQINQLMKLKVEKKGSNSGLLSEGFHGAVKMDRVSFRYGPDQDPALLGVSFEAKPGEIIAIVGYTGSGKSTLLKMIAGMYKPQAGALYMDNLDIRQLNSMELRRSVAYVPQKIQMFHGTIAQNLRLNDGMSTDEELKEAARKAGVLDDIMALPDGFNTRISDGSVNKFPPGFMRALSIARALSSSAKIILFDEPGASLDDESDQLFMKQLEQLRGSCTVIMVSHRPSHIRLADKAVLIDQGSVQFVGAPKEAISIMMGTKQ